MFMKKVFLLIIAAFILSANSFGQLLTREGKCGRKGPKLCPKFTVFHETNYDFKKFGFNSLNVDYILLCQAKYMLSFRFGLSYMSFNKSSSYGFPLELNLLIGNGAALFEISGGYVDQLYYKNYNEVLKQMRNSNFTYRAISGRIGFRYEQPKGGLFIRVGFTPIYSLVGQDLIYAIGDRRFIPMFGAGLGYTF